MFKKSNKLLVSLLLAVIFIFTTTTGAFAQALNETHEQAKEESEFKTLPVIKGPFQSKYPPIEMSFNIQDRKAHTKTVTLTDGTVLKLGAEPASAGNIEGSISIMAALNGVWKIWGENGLARMEYYIDLAPTYRGSNYTKITDEWGLAVTGRLSSFDNETINVVRRSETSSKPAVVEGYAKFNYLGNQWISVWTQSGGVRATISKGKLTTTLY